MLTGWNEPDRRAGIVNRRSTMKIRTIPRPDGIWIKISSRNSFHSKLKFLGLTLGCVAIAGLAFQWNPFGTHYWVPAIIALLAIALGFGEIHFSIKPDQFIRVELRLLGLTWFRHSVPKSKIHSTVVHPAEAGDFTLRLLDASGQRLLTIEHFATEHEARRVSRMFVLDKALRSEAVNQLVDEFVVQDRESNPWIVWLIPPLGFGMIPLMLEFSVDDMGSVATSCVLGVFITTCAILIARRNEGIISITGETGQVDRWQRHGLFRRIIYRERIGENPPVDFLQSRFDPANLCLGVVLVLQIVCILQLSDWRANRSSAMRKAPKLKQPEDAATRKRSMDGRLGLLAPVA